MSPYVFIILSELLSRIIYKVEADGLFDGVKLARLALPITHLAFADDMILFCRATFEEVRNIKRCLELYCGWSGQGINLSKSGVFFSKNVRAQ